MLHYKDEIAFTSNQIRSIREIFRVNDKEFVQAVRDLKIEEAYASVYSLVVDMNYVNNSKFIESKRTFLGNYDLTPTDFKKMFANITIVYDIFNAIFDDDTLQVQDKDRLVANAHNIALAKKTLEGLLRR